MGQVSFFSEPALGLYAKHVCYMRSMLHYFYNIAPPLLMLHARLTQYINFIFVSDQPRGNAGLLSSFYVDDHVVVTAARNYYCETCTSTSWPL